MKGYIYILMNGSFLELIKIGYTSKTPLERAKKLSSSSGVPTPYFVAYERYVQDKCRETEKEIHARLQGFKVNREFFRYPISGAIQLVEEVCREADI